MPDRSDSAGGHGSPRTLYTAAAGLLLLCGWFWFTLDRLKYPIFHYLRDGGTPGGLPSLVTGLLDWPDYLPITGALLCAAFVLHREWRQRALSMALREAPAFPFFVFLVALLVFFAHAYLYAGYQLAGDAGSHIMRTAHLRMGLESGIFPAWDNYFYAGATLLQFTGPLYFWISALLDTAIQDASLSTKTLLFTLHVGSGLAMFRLLLAYGLGRVAALAGALSYAGSFAHLHLMVWESTYPQSITWLVLPVSIGLIERTFRSNGHFTGSWLALTLVDAVLLVNHQASGVYVGVFIALYVLTSLLLGRAPWTRLVPILTSALASILLSLFAYLPILIEKTWVMMYDKSGALLFLAWPDPAWWRDLVLWSNADSRGADAVYIGISVLALAAIGLTYALRNTAGRHLKLLTLLMLAGLLASLVLRGMHVRQVIVTLFFLSALAGIGTHILLYEMQLRRSVPALILLILLTDLGFTAVQPISRTDKAYFDVAGRYLIANAPGERILLTASNQADMTVSIGPGGPPLLYYPVQTLTGAHNLAATLSHNYIAGTIKLAERDLNDRQGLSDDTETLLEMFNVGRLINDTGTSLGLPQDIANTVEEPPLGSVLRTGYPSPVIFSNRLVTVEIPPGLDKPMTWNEDFDPAKPAPIAIRIQDFLGELLERSQYDTRTGSAARLPVRGDGGRTGPDDGIRPPPADWNGRLQHYRVLLDRVELDVHSELEGYLQVTHPWYPTVQVLRNGMEVSPARGAMDLLVLPVSSGQNHYTIRYPRSALRSLLGGFSLAVLATLLAGCSLRAIMRSRKPGDPDGTGLRDD